MTVIEHIGSRVRLVTRAFGSRDYRLYFFGLAVSMTGSWMQNVAMGWLVCRLTSEAMKGGLVGFVTKSALVLGVVGFLGQIPSLLLGPVAGVMLDRIGKRRVIIITQSLAAVQAFALALLVFSHSIAIWHIIVLAQFIGCVNAVDVPARQSFVVHVVGNRDHLGNAIALNSVIFNSARLLGPSLGGLVITVFGNEGICFLANAVSYGAAIGALVMLRTREQIVPRAAPRFLHELREGVRAAFGSPAVRALLLLTGWTSLVAMPYGTLVPLFARDILKGNAQTFGFLHSSVAVGALCGALYLASRASIKGLGSVVALASMLCGIGLTGFALSRHMQISMIMMAITGLGVLMQLASTNTLIQTLVDDDKRARVLSLYTTSMFGIVPCGCLLFGWLAQRIGAPRAQFIGGMLTICAALVYATRLPALRAVLGPLYHKVKLAFRLGPPLDGA